MSLSFSFEAGASLTVSAQCCARLHDEPAPVDEKNPLRGVTLHCGGDFLGENGFGRAEKGRGAREGSAQHGGDGEFALVPAEEGVEEAQAREAHERFGREVGQGREHPGR